MALTWLTLFIWFRLLASAIPELCRMSLMQVFVLLFLKFPAVLVHVWSHFMVIIRNWWWKVPVLLKACTQAVLGQCLHVGNTGKMSTVLMMCLLVQNKQAGWGTGEVQDGHGQCFPHKTDAGHFQPTPGQVHGVSTLRVRVWITPDHTLSES